MTSMWDGGKEKIGREAGLRDDDASRTRCALRRTDAVPGWLPAVRCLGRVKKRKRLGRPHCSWAQDPECRRGHYSSTFPRPPRSTAHDGCGGGLGQNRASNAGAGCKAEGVGKT